MARRSADMDKVRTLFRELQSDPNSENLLSALGSTLIQKVLSLSPTERERFDWLLSCVHDRAPMQAVPEKRKRKNPAASEVPF